MAQLISSSSSSSTCSATHHKSPTSIPLPSSKSSPLVNAPPQSSPSASQTKHPERISTDIPIVAINFSGTSPTSNLPPPSLLTKQQAPPPSLLNRQSAEFSSDFEKSVLIGLGFGSDLGIGVGSSSDIAQARRRFLEEEVEEEEDGSDLGLVNISPITYTAPASGMPSEMGSGIQCPREETFTRATQHLRRDSDARQKREDIDNATIAKEEELKTLIAEKEAQRPRVVERENSEDVIVVPDFRTGAETGVSAAEERRRRRRLERRQSAQNTPVVSPEFGQRGWGRRG